MAHTESFGQLLRRYRRAAGLTQRELAELAQVSLRTVTNLEMPRAQHPHEATLRLIAEALALNAEQWALLQRCLIVGTADVPTATAARAGLPTFETTFVGRDAELVELRALSTPVADVALRDDVPFLPRAPRLLTLLGGSGYGKTRLAVALANNTMNTYRDGVCFVELTGLTTPDGVMRAVARAIGLQVWLGPAPLDPLIATLRSQQLLIVLDDADAVLDSCATFADTVLRRCPEVQLLVTSREPLQIEGEQVWRVAPLALPAATIVAGAETAWRAALPALRASAAVRLFADRAALVVPDFAVSLDNAGPLDTLCRILGGVPLAIELVAAQVAHRTLPDLAAQLVDLPQEQLLDGVLAWRYHALPATDRALLRFLAPFVGRWPGEVGTASARLACGDAASGVLPRLIAAGLVQREQYGEVEVYRLPGPVRAFALAQLRAVGDEAAANAGLLAWCLGLAQRAAASAARGTPDEHITAADDHLCHALIWALAYDPVGGRQLAAALHNYLLAVRPGATGWARLLPLIERTALPPFPDAPKSMGIAP